jgi:spore maturation protein CgeB
LYHYGINPDGDFVNPRTFEIASCKGFQLLDNRSDLISLFNIDEELVIFNSIDELKDQINFYIANPEMRSEISNRSYHRVLEEHTIEHRMQELLIHVFINRFDSLKKIEASRLDPLSYLIEKAGRDTTLGKYMEKFEGSKNFSLKTMATHIHNGKGDLDDNETLLMMLDQLMQEKI